MNTKQQRFLINTYRVYVRRISRPIYKRLRKLGFSIKAALFVCFWLYLVAWNSLIVLILPSDWTIYINMIISTLFAPFLVFIQMTMHKYHRE